MNESKRAYRLFSTGLFLLSLPVLSVSVSCHGRLRIPDAYRNSIQTFVIEHDGIARKNLVYIPKTIRARPALLLVFHGGGGTPEGMVGMDHGRLLELADQSGFAVVYPEGVGKAWNDFRRDPLSEAHRTNRDDVGFIGVLIQTMAARHGIDSRRVYAAGISNGGFFSLRLACEASDRIAGAVIVTATLPEDGVKLCNPVRPVDLVFVNGTEDPLVPYEGGEVKVFGSRRGRILSTDASLAFFASRFGCNAPFSTALPVRVADDTTRVIRHDWQCPGSRLQLYEIKGGGHTWPGGVQYLGPGLVGRVSKQLMASDVIGDLLK